MKNMNSDKTKYLYDTTFLIGGWRRRAAIHALAESPDPADIVVLAEAVVQNHPNRALILATLGRLSPEHTPEKVALLWTTWSKSLDPALTEVVARLGWPSALPMDSKLARTVLGLANSDANAPTLRAVAALSRALPNDENWNDALHIAWIHSLAPELEQVITDQNRQPGNPAFEALHALASTQIQRYTALEDTDGSILARAFAIAPAALRERMARVVAGSTDRRLKDSYRRALTGGNLDEMRILANLKLVGDEDGLFEKTRFLRLGTVLELCERWANNSRRPARVQAQEIIERAVHAYRALGPLPLETVPSLPEGLSDIFDNQVLINEDLMADLQSKNPVQRVRALYFNHKQGLTDRQIIETTARSEHWLERLVTRLIDANLLLKAREEHVLWVSACAGEAALLQTPIAGTPEDYHRNSNLLQNTPTTKAPRIHALLDILCAFQGAFVASGITVDDIEEAIDPNAIEIEEAEEEF